MVAALAIAAAAWLFVRWRSPRPEFPPLPTSPDDPLMKEALAKARASIGEFMALARAPKESALVKLHFVSSSGQLDRVYRCTLEDVEDWQVRDASGKVHGGFTQRAMFAIARRDGVKLPRKLLEHEREHGEP